MSQFIPFVLSLAICILTMDRLASADPKKPDGRKANRLAKESSPYLIQHAHNPVDWYPWGAEAFERAKKEKKLIFLSIGYSACHWCHVMERETFSNEAIAKVLNANFICIKVDREERPDVDEIYMAALNATGVSGGWPLTMFLTPEGKPIFGGTYFPPKDKKVEGGTITGMDSILKRVMDLNEKEGPALEAQANLIARRTVETLEQANSRVPLAPLDRELIADSVRWFEFDPVHGGLGDRLRQFQGTKFPRATALSFLHSQSQKPKNEDLANSIALTLNKMAEGGIYDQLGGGFHRYSTERTWTIPHFEKMLYDNAQLVELYAEAYRVRPDPVYRRLVEESLEFIAREMTNPDGVFYSALDADSNGVEGEYYVWTKDELEKVIGKAEDFEFFKSVYSISEPNFEEKSQILRLPKPHAQIANELKFSEKDYFAKLKAIQSQLFAHREKRERPFLDQKVITSWNGQMIAGYARAGEVFQKPDYLETARNAASFLLERMRTKDGRLMRIYAAVPGEKPAPRGNAFLDDYSYLIHGLLTLHDATKEDRWLKEAEALAQTMIRWYGDRDRGGFFFTAHDHEKLFARSKDSYDGAQPSGNGMAARSLLKLWQKTGKAEFKEESLRTIRYFAGSMKSSPGSMTSLAMCLDAWLDLSVNDPSIMKAPMPAVVKNAPKEAADVVKALFKKLKPEKGVQSFSITLTIEEPWHLYANPVGNDSLKDSETVVEVLVGGKAVKAEIEYPDTQPLKDSSGEMYQVYKGTVVITGSIPLPNDQAEWDVRVRILACKDRLCLLPSTLKLK